jgi:hypothetical protein
MLIAKEKRMLPDTILYLLIGFALVCCGYLLASIPHIPPNIGDNIRSGLGVPGALIFLWGLVRLLLGILWFHLPMIGKNK